LFSNYVRLPSTCGYPLPLFYQRYVRDWLTLITSLELQLSLFTLLMVPFGRCLNFKRWNSLRQLPSALRPSVSRNGLWSSPDSAFPPPIVYGLPVTSPPLHFPCTPKHPSDPVFSRGLSIFYVAYVTHKRCSITSLVPSRSPFSSSLSHFTAFGQNTPCCMTRRSFPESLLPPPSPIRMLPSETLGGFTRFSECLCVIRF